MADKAAVQRHEKSIANLETSLEAVKLLVVENKAMMDSKFLQLTESQEEMKQGFKEIIELFKKESVGNKNPKKGEASSSHTQASSTLTEAEQETKDELRDAALSLVDCNGAREQNIACNGNIANSSEGSGISDLEQMIQQKTFTRSEIDRLTELLHSRTTEISFRDEEKRNEGNLLKPISDIEKSNVFTRSPLQENRDESNKFQMNDDGVNREPIKLTPNMLHGQALRSMENSDMPKLLQNQDGERVEDSSNALPNAGGEASCKKKIIEENGFKEFNIPLKLTTSFVDANATISMTNAVPNIKNGDSIVSKFAAQPQKKRGFRMSANEDFPELDDDTHTNGFVSVSSGEGREGLQTSHKSVSPRAIALQTISAKPEGKILENLASNGTNDVKISSGHVARKEYTGIQTPAVVAPISNFQQDMPVQSTSVVNNSIPFRDIGCSPTLSGLSSKNVDTLPSFTFSSSPCGESTATTSSLPSLSQSQSVFGSTAAPRAPGNSGDQMNMEDSMAEDPVHSSNPAVPVFGQQLVPSSSPTVPVFGQPSISSSTPTVPEFGQPSVSSSTPTVPVFGQPSISSSSPTVPVFGQPSVSLSNPTVPVFGQPSFSSSNPTVPVFGQGLVSQSPPGFMFGSTAPPSPFQFGGQQNQATPQNLPSFQASNSLDFNSGGSFSLGSGGGDKSSRKTVRVSRNRNRKK